MANHSDVSKALASMAVIFGKGMNQDAVDMMVQDLMAFDPGDVIKALHSCRMELKWFPTLADIVSRMQASDGRPGIEEAWAMCPKDESKSVYLNDEVMAGWSAANEVLRDSKDMIGARMAFKEVYEKAVKQNRGSGVKPKWFLSNGHDKHGREAALRDAVEKKRLTASEATKLLPNTDFTRNAPSGLPEPRKSIEDFSTMGEISKKIIEQSRDKK